MVNFTVRLPEDAVKILKARSIQTNESVSSIARRFIVQGVRQETTLTVEGVVRKESDRLAKLIIRTMKAAAAGMYLAAEAAGGTEAPARLDDALGMAAKYVKLPYAGEGSPLLVAESQGLVSITDEEFFELCGGDCEQS